MEDQVVRIRRRVPRKKKTFGQRVERLILAPHLTPSKRAQRMAIIAAIVLMGVYLMVSPILSDMFGRKETAPSAAASPAAPPPHALGKKK
jgi:hypothetical protein